MNDRPGSERAADGDAIRAAQLRIEARRRELGLRRGPRPVAEALRVVEPPAPRPREVAHSGPPPLAVSGTFLEDVAVAIVTEAAEFKRAAGTGTYRSPGWTLANVLRENPHLSGRSPLDVLREVGAALAFIAGVNGGDGDGWARLPQVDTFGNAVDPGLSFLSAWKREGASLDGFLSAADRHPIDVPEIPPGERYHALRRFASLVSHLVNRHGPDRAIPLPCRRLSELLGCGKTQVAQYIRFLVSCGLLVKTSEAWGRKGDGAGVVRRAAEFRWLGPLPAVASPAVVDETDRRSA